MFHKAVHVVHFNKTSGLNDNTAQYLVRSETNKQVIRAYHFGVFLIQWVLIKVFLWGLATIFKYLLVVSNKKVFSNKAPLAPLTTKTFFLCTTTYVVHKKNFFNTSSRMTQKQQCIQIRKQYNTD